VDVIADATGSEGLSGNEYIKSLASVGHWTATPEGQRSVRAQLRADAAAEGEAERRGVRRARARRMQRAMRALFEEAAPSRTRGLSPMVKCRWTRFRDSDVGLNIDVNGRGSWRGLASCGRRSCPVCGPRLLADDARLVEAGVAEHGYTRTLMSTLTVRHKREQTLLDNRRGVVLSWGHLQRQRAFKELLCRHAGKVFVRALEVTHGDANGWHVHYHVLVFVHRELSDEETLAFETEWSKLWQRSVTRAMGGEHRPTLANGVRLTPCHRADYLTKLGIGAEVTDVGQAKTGKGRSYWRIMNDWFDTSADPGARDARLLVEFVRDMRSAVIVAWPRRGPHTRKNIKLRHPEEKPAIRESAAMHGAEWDELRRRTLDGIDGPLVVLRAAEQAFPGYVQRAVDEAVSRVLQEGTPARAAPCERTCVRSTRVDAKEHESRAGPAP
jgi:hypothetical protein